MKNNNWLIASKATTSSNMNIVNKSKEWILYSSHKYEIIQKKGIYIIIDGYLLPRSFCFAEYKGLDQYQLISVLFNKYNENLVNYIKGVYNLVIVYNEKFYILNDHMSIKKFFIYVDGKQFYISNDIQLIKDNIKVEFDLTQIAISSIFHHYLYGNTAFKNIKYSLPSQRVLYNKTLLVDTYWSVETLIKETTNELEPEEFADQLSKLIKEYLVYLSPKEVSQTLTGGLDSRTILSALLKNEINPRAYTYGNPDSRDVKYAKLVANELNLDYLNHYPELNSDWFQQYADRIVKEGNSLCSVHRAHRLDCVINSAASEDELLIGGYMGNETIRGLSYDDLIISKFLRLWWSNSGNKKELISDTLKEYFFEIKEFDVDRIYEEIMSFNFIKNDMTRNHFYATFDIKATNHHYQDPYLFSNKVKYPLPIFMDIDLLEKIFSSDRNILYLKQNETFMEKVKSHEFNLRIISHLAPGLNDLPFGKNGFYTINEYNGSKLVLYLKRFIRQKTERKYPANFVLGDWLKQYIHNSLSKLKEDEILSDLIDYEFLQESFDKEQSTCEKDLLKYTNLITLNKILR